MPKRKSILLAPLDWGLGHATRMVPVIRHLSEGGHEVVLASVGRSEAFLKEEFPDLTHLDIPAYGIAFSGKSVVLDISMQVPGMIKTIDREREWLREILQKRSFDGVISDNRYGLDVHPRSVLVTHQLMPLVPFAVKNWVRRKLNHIYDQFEEIWVPDVEGSDSMAGRLSHPDRSPDKVTYVGMLSRFTEGARKPEAEQDIDWLITLSGPEGQRKISEEMVLTRFGQDHGKVVLLRGLPGSKDVPLPGDVEAIAHPTDEAFVELIYRSKNILTTSGYSTIMDLIALGRSAWLMPTPGQSEQEYLADFLSGKGWFKQVSRRRLLREELTSLPDTVPQLSQDFKWLDAWVDSL